MVIGTRRSHFEQIPVQTKNSLKTKENYGIHRKVSYSLILKLKTLIKEKIIKEKKHSPILHKVTIEYIKRIW